MAQIRIHVSMITTCAYMVRFTKLFKSCCNFFLFYKLFSNLSCLDMLCLKENKHQNMISFGISVLYMYFLYSPLATLKSTTPTHCFGFGVANKSLVSIITLHLFPSFDTSFHGLAPLAMIWHQCQTVHHPFLKITLFYTYFNPYPPSYTCSRFLCLVSQPINKPFGVRKISNHPLFTAINFLLIILYLVTQSCKIHQLSTLIFKYLCVSTNFILSFLWS